METWTCLLEDADGFYKRFLGMDGKDGIMGLETMRIAPSGSKRTE